MLFKASLLLLLILSSVLADSINISVNSQSCNNGGDLTSAITNLPQCTSDAIFNTLVSGLIYSAKQFFDSAISFLTASPDIKWFCIPYNNIMAILETFYTVILLCLGIYYIVNSTDVEGRTKAKTWLKNMFLMVITLSFSFNIFQTIMDVNGYFSSSVYASVNSNLFQINAELSNLVFALVISSTLMLSGLVTFFTLIIRYIMIPFLLFLFPISIFLYFIPFTKDWGAFILKFSMLIIFMSSIDSVLLLGLSSLFSAPDPNLASDFIRAMALLLGFGSIGFVNLIIFLVAALSVISQAIKIVESIVSAVMKVAILTALL